MEKEEPCTLLTGMQTDVATMEVSMVVSCKTTNDPAIPLLGVYTPKKLKSVIGLLTAVLLMTVRKLRQSRCPSTKEWIKKMKLSFSTFIYLMCM